MKPDLSVNLCNKKLENPLILASGFLGTEAELLVRVAKAGAGAVTTKSCGLKSREGHENPTVLAWEHGVLNAVGLTNPGVKEEVREIQKLKKLLKTSKILIIASFFGATFREFVQVAKELSKAKPDFLEMNISCPNTEDEFGRPFATNPKDTYKITKMVKKVTKIPLIVKLSPNVTDIKVIAKAASDAGTDVISAINTVTGMIIDIESGKPILTNKIGGVSGPAVKPVAVRCVYQIAQVVKIPIIGLGGVTCGEDAIEMIMAGAQAVGIGSAIHYQGIRGFSKINKEMKDFMIAHKYKSLKEFRGIAHEKN